jgi:hypothetical protein
MSKRPTKAASNVYCMARIDASTFNEKLSSREGASEITGIDRTRIARMELDTITPYPEEVIVMADTYKMPELMNWYCANECPIGKKTVKEIEVKELAPLTICVCSALQKTEYVREALIDIVADGQITEQEKPELEKVLNVLEQIGKTSEELKLWVKKNLE